MKAGEVLDHVAQAASQGSSIFLATPCDDFSVDDFIEQAEARGLMLIPSHDGKISVVEHGSDRLDLSRQTGAFGWHKDGLYRPSLPHFVLLYCDNPGRGDAHTAFADTFIAAESLTAEVGATVNQVSLIYESRDGKRFPRPLIGRHSRSSERVINIAQRGRFRLRSEGAKNALARHAGAGLRALVERQLDLAHVSTHVWRKGDLVIFDNERFAHARLGSSPDLKRRLMRMWFSAGVHGA